MRKRVVILGTTMFSAELSYILKSEDYEVIAFTLIPLLKRVIVMMACLSIPLKELKMKSILSP